MEQWEAMMGGKTFITDLGEERHAEINGVDTVVGRYAAVSYTHLTLPTKLEV